MQPLTRVLDLDLDFFVYGAASWRAHDDDRLDSEEYPPWAINEALAFLRDRCLLTGPLPGMVVERHGELFGRWRTAIHEGLLTPPLSITHVDAHADIGMGDSGYVYLLTDLLRHPVQARQFPRIGDRWMGDGNYLAFAIACRWVRDLAYVFNSEGPGRPTDILSVLMKDFDFNARSIQLACMDGDQIQRTLWPESPPPHIHHLEPEVPFEHMPWPAFQASGPFDIICLARSAAFTPAESDALFDEIRDQFIDESAFP